MTAARNDELTVIACQGWENPDARCPHLFSSRASDAWHLGQHLRRNGDPRPSSVQPSRGNNLRVNRTLLYWITYGPTGTTDIQLGSIAA